MPREEMLVRAEARQSSSPYFTDGATYLARRLYSGDMPLRVWEVADDRGHLRVIIPGEICPHFVSPFAGPLRELTHGRFVDATNSREIK